MLLKNEKNNTYEEIKRLEEITYEDLYKKYRGNFLYDKILVKADNEYKSMCDEIGNTENVEYLDIRDHGANLSYQAGISFVFLAALYEISGKTDAIIDNAMSKGLYIKIENGCQGENFERQITEKMQHIIDEDMTILKIGENRYKLGEVEMDFPHIMVPSTSYIKQFEFRKYEKGFLLRFPHMNNPNVIPVYKEEKLLYEAFAEMDKWQKMLNISYVDDLNEIVRADELAWTVQVSEALHEKRIVEITKQIVDSGKRIVLIAGPSSSGKTTFAKRLAVQLFIAGEKPVYLGMDNYFKNREDSPLLEDGTRDFESLAAVDVELFNMQLTQLLAGERIELPEYDFVSGKRVYKGESLSIAENQVIIIEGIHCLNDQLTPRISSDDKFRIYISPLTGLNVNKANRISTTDCRQIRRIVRDCKYRGKTPESAIRSWKKVREGEEVNIFPYNGTADAFFNSVHIYEMCVLKKYAMDILREIDEKQPEYAEAKRLLAFLELFEMQEEDGCIPYNSILREFIGV